LKTILENGVGVVNIREDIAGVVESLRPEMVKFLVDLCSIPAVNPSFGGEGEYRRATWLANFLEEHDLPVQIMEVDDQSVPEGKRLNLVSRLRGSGEQGTLWIAAHMDTVAAGDMNTWETDPFSPVVRDGRIYGRGVEDNGQAIACMVYSLANMLVDGVIVQRLGDLMKGRRSTDERIAKGLVIPTLQEATPGDLSLVLPYRHFLAILEMLKALDQVAPGVYSPHTLLYGVEVKFYSSRLEVSRTLETKVNNLFVAGDGAGITRGLAQASLSGVMAGREIGVRLE
jgi:hypothetical protein